MSCLQNVRIAWSEPNPISVHSKRSVSGNVAPLQEPAKFMTGSPPVPKKSVRKARATTSTLGSSQTDASVPPSWPKLHNVRRAKKVLSTKERRYSWQKDRKSWQDWPEQ